MKYYITWQNGAMLYWNGEQFSDKKEGAFIGFEEDCQQEIEANELKFTTLEPAFADPVGFMLGKLQLS